MDTEAACCQVCETLRSPLTCANCLCQPQQLGDDWIKLGRLKAACDARRTQLDTALSLQVSR